ncbi:uncharacterized protein ALTATR162_LOCUS1236 [Alternaria atra]|uniref:Uncharacterized protein n=1 Tax=Alternaria atra TaxID=119953 RepID=A0A8J2HVR4_9PLEO|nr:uncharacterized protein ALTATR162_LOCUS1236 [Alternaria atra]CAG5142845.1 unnamed protein product [Alternaria atra]
MAPSHNEGVLRRRAIQYLREFPRPSPHKRRLSDADPDETSDDEAEEYQQHTKLQPSTSTPQSGSMPPSKVCNVDRHITHKSIIHRDPDPNFLVRHLIEHTSLITSLLQLYPHSTDQKGLRNDVSMMVQVQNQYVTDWMKAESQSSRKRQKNNDESTVSLDNRPQPIINPATRVQNEQDLALRQILSANADMWQDDTGHGVADVFAVVPASSPVASSFGGRIAGSTHMPSTSMAHGLLIQEKLGTTGSALTTPKKHIPNSAVGSARYKGMPTTLNMEDIQAKLGGPSINPKVKSKSLTDLSLHSSSFEGLATPIKTNLHPINALITPSPNRIHDPSSSRSNQGKSSEHATTQHPAPSSDDDRLHVRNNGNASSKLHSESSYDSRIGNPGFRFERRVDAVHGRIGANPLLKE